MGLGNVVYVEWVSGYLVSSKVLTVKYCEGVSMEGEGQSEGGMFLQPHLPIGGVVGAGCQQVGV